MHKTRGDVDGDSVGNACDRCPGDDDGAAWSFEGEIICPSQCDGNRPPEPHCPEVIHAPVDDVCRWQTAPDALTPGAQDPDGHSLACATRWGVADHNGDGMGGGAGQGLRALTAHSICIDACGASSHDACATRVVPVDEMAPIVEVGQALSTFVLAPEWVQNWHNVRHLCQIAWSDNCTDPDICSGEIDDGVCAVGAPDMAIELSDAQIEPDEPVVITVTGVDPSLIEKTHLVVDGRPRRRSTPRA